MLRDLFYDFTTIYGFDHLCPLCGQVKEVVCSSAICDELALDWQLTNELQRAFDYREGCACKHCGATVRVMNLSLTLLETINRKYSAGYQFVRDVDWQALPGLTIAEVNNCGILHSYLKEIPGLSFSEYGSTDAAVKSEDLMKLSYSDSYFDIVMTSDVLEHVPNYCKALSEIDRVLKDDGVFIFTVPWLPERKTVVRARADNKGEVELLEKASFHGEYSLEKDDYLVFYEFGYDFVAELQEIFKVEIYCQRGFGGVISSVFVCRKW